MKQRTEPRIPYDLPKHASEGSLYTRQETAEVFQDNQYEPILPRRAFWKRIIFNQLPSISYHTQLIHLNFGRQIFHCEVKVSCKYNNFFTRRAKKRSEHSAARLR